MNADVLLFFEGDEQALMLFECLSEQLMARWPQTAVKVQRSQITFQHPRGYCYASRRGRGRLVVSFGLGYALQSPRLLAVANPAPGRYTHHVAVRSAAELDRELLEWVAEAYAFMQRPKKRG